jgi:transposase-like protein
MDLVKMKRILLRAIHFAPPETVRQWVRQAEVDDGQRPRGTAEESAGLRWLKCELAELRRANAILKAASVFFATHQSHHHRGTLTLMSRNQATKGAVSVN